MRVPAINGSATRCELPQASCAAHPPPLEREAVAKMAESAVLAAPATNSFTLSDWRTASACIALLTLLLQLFRHMNHRYRLCRLNHIYGIVFLVEFPLKPND